MQQMPLGNDPNIGQESAGADKSAHVSPDVKMMRLAESYRCLEYKPGVRPWNAAELADWVRSGEANPAEAQAAEFVLEVANMSAVWDVNPRPIAAQHCHDDFAKPAAWTTLSQPPASSAIY